MSISVRWRSLIPIELLSQQPLLLIFIGVKTFFFLENNRVLRLYQAAFGDIIFWRRGGFLVELMGTCLDVVVTELWRWAVAEKQQAIGDFWRRTGLVILVIRSKFSRALGLRFIIFVIDFLILRSLVLVVYFYQFNLLCPLMNRTPRIIWSFNRRINVMIVIMHLCVNWSDRVAWISCVWLVLLRWRFPRLNWLLHWLLFLNYVGTLRLIFCFRTFLFDHCFFRSSDLLIWENLLGVNWIKGSYQFLLLSGGIVQAGTFQMPGALILEGSSLLLIQ